KLLGFSVSADGPLRRAWAIGQSVLAGQTNTAAFAIGCGTFAVIVVLKRWPRVPGILIAVVLATVVVAVTGVAQTAGVSVLGTLPRGLPLPRVPFIGFGDLQPVIVGGAAVALVSFADTSVLSRTYAARLRTPVDPNREMRALGIANLAAAFF